MFEQSFVQATAKTQRVGPVALSLMLQVSVIGTGILIPLINPDLLPAVMTGNSLFLAPPTPPPAQPPKTQLATAVTHVVRQLRNGVLIMPAAIPDKVTMIEDPPEIPIGVGVPGGVPGGYPGPSGGIVESLWGGVTNTTTPPPPAPVAAKDTERNKPIARHRIGGNVQDAMVISRKIPDYPPLARQQRVEGKVMFQAVIGTTGAIQQLQLISGHPLLVQAAMDAVRQWRYRPTMLNGDPIEVDTVISVTFTLNR